MKLLRKQKLEKWPKKLSFQENLMCFFFLCDLDMTMSVGSASNKYKNNLTYHKLFFIMTILPFPFKDQQTLQNLMLLHSTAKLAFLYVTVNNSCMVLVWPRLVGVGVYSNRALAWTVFALTNRLR